MVETEFVRMLVSRGMTYQDAHIVEDMGTHASAQALDALMRAVDAAPDHLQALVTTAAMAMLRGNMEKGIEYMTGKAAAVAEQEGL